MGTPLRVIEHLGIKVPVHADFPAEIVRALETGSYEWPEWLVLERILVQGDAVFEIGGGCGFLSARTARDPRVARVITAEANPALLPLIKELHELNQVSADIVGAAIGTNDGSALLDIHPQFWGSRVSETGGGANLVQVPAMSLSRCLDTFLPSVLVVDVEGYELSLFREISSLGPVRHVVIELHEWFYGLSGVEQVIQAFAKIGFFVDPEAVCGGVVAFKSAHGSDADRLRGRGAPRGLLETDLRPLEDRTPLAPFVERVVSSGGEDRVAMEVLAFSAAQNNIPLAVPRAVGMTWMRLGEWHRALLTYRHILSRPEVKAVAGDLMTMAWIMNALGDSRRMIHLANMAVELDPEAEPRISLTTR